MISLMMGMGVMSYSTLHEQKNIANEDIRMRFSEYQSATVLLVKLNINNKSLYQTIGYANWSDGEERMESGFRIVLNDLRLLVTSIQTQVNESKVTKNKQRLELLMETEKLIVAYQVLVEEAAEWALIDISATNMLLEDLQVKFTSISDIFLKIQTLDQKKNEEALQQSDDNADSAMFWLILLLFVAIVISIIISFYIAIGITRQIKKVEMVIGNVSEGDLTKRIHVSTHDEIGSLAEHFNDLIDVLQRKVIGQIINSSESLNKAADDTNSASKETMNGVNLQREETGNINSAIGEMVQTSQELAANAAQSSVAAKDAEDEVSNNSETMNETVDAINSVAETISDATVAIQQLGKDSENVSVVLDVIRSIAEQTNLLSLNAAIEAARAGDQGRGFAVVADEVRVLAQRTQHSTEEIQSIIERLQDGVTTVVKVIEDGQVHVNGSVKSAENTKISLAAIGESVSTISANTENMASMIEEQHMVTSNIGDSISSIMESGNNTTKLAETSSSASLEIKRLVDELQSLIAVYRV